MPWASDKGQNSSKGIDTFWRPESKHSINYLDEDAVILFGEENHRLMWITYL